MLKKERADFILRTLEEKFPNPPIPLSHENIFQLLVAVLLSAQCTDERVNKVTPALFSKAKNSKEMANLSTSEILNFIRSCGLAPKKSEAITKLSKILVEEFDGAVYNMSSLIEPIMIVFMGLMIGGLMIAMYSPIFNVGALIN